MDADQILNRFRESNALLDGHFLLSSGLHSSNYLQSALALQYPAHAAKFGRAIGKHFAEHNIETVASPAIGGLVIGYATAAAMNVRFIWSERQNGVVTLRRGFSIKKGERVLVVEDVITTGGSVRECIDALKQAGADVIAAASIVDRSAGRADVGVPRISLATMDVPSWPADACPMCANGDVAVKPGSRA